MPPATVLPRLDSLTMLAATVYQEAAGELFEGKEAVAGVIVNRAHARGRSVLDIVLEPWQFSAWNTDAPTRMRLDDLLDTAWADCMAAAAGQLFRDQLGRPDPSKGAWFYLNVDVVKRGRGDGTLPAWAADPTDATKINAAKVLVVLGRHTFLKA